VWFAAMMPGMGDAFTLGSAGESRNGGVSITVESVTPPPGSAVHASKALANVVSSE